MLIKQNKNSTICIILKRSIISGIGLFNNSKRKQESQYQFCFINSMVLNPKLKSPNSKRNFFVVEKCKIFMKNINYKKLEDNKDKLTLDLNSTPSKLYKTHIGSLAFFPIQNLFYNKVLHMPPILLYTILLCVIE